MSAPAQSFSNLYNFSAVPSNAVGQNPSGLTLASNGQIYGTCVNGGTNEFGSLYTITTTGTASPLCSMSNNAAGDNPIAALAQGTNGLFYGLNQSAGSNQYGAIFDLSSAGTLTKLYSFTTLKYNSHTSLFTNADGAYPDCALALNTNNGNFYGTAGNATYYGGTNGYGTIFQVTHQGKVTVIYSFTNGTDGALPAAPLLVYTNGVLYGTTSAGGSNGYGTIFKLTAAGVVTPLYSFRGAADGSAPTAALIDGKDGYLYGACSAGGTNGSGSIFKVNTNGILTTLYAFTPGMNFNGTSGVANQYNADGIEPNVLVLGNDGNLYGTAHYGGVNGAGSVFELSRAGQFKVLYSFSYAADGGPNTDGANPTSLIQLTNGNFYGTTKDGGTNSFGTFFTIGLPPSITVQPTNQSIALHSNASFSLTASNALTYQWQFDGANLPTGTGSTLSVTNAQITNAGSYWAVVTGINGPTTSSVVTLSLTNVPVSFVNNASALQYSGGQFSIQLTNLTGQGAIIIESSTNLIQWTPIYTNPSAFGTALFIDPNAGNYPFQFYRATTP